MLKNFLVTGGSGFIGSHFVDLLLSKNLNVINVDLKKEDIKRKNKNYKFKQGNICNFNFLNKIITKKTDCIVNFAAQTHVDRSIDFPKDFVQNNIIGTFNLLEVIRKKKSTLYLFKYRLMKCLGVWVTNKKVLMKIV